MGGNLSCASGRRKGAFDYTVTIEPSDRVSLASLTLDCVYETPPPPLPDTVPLDTSDVTRVAAASGRKFTLKKEEKPRLSTATNESCHADSSSSPWKFWRRLSSRSRQEHKSVHRKDRPSIALLDKADSNQNATEVSSEQRLSQNAQPASRSLPDVVEKAQNVAKCSTNGVPPPKPPRLFLFRTPSSVTKHSTDTENESDPTYMNCKQAPDIRPDNFTSSLDSTHSEPLLRASSYIKSLKLSDMSENNNLLGQVSKNDLGPPGSAPVTSVSFNLPPEYSSYKPSHDIIPQGFQNSIGKPKIKTPEMSLKRNGRPRRKSSDKGEITRQKLIMNSIAELLRQRLDPFPLIDQLKKAGVLNNMDVQFFLGLHDRKSVCENLVGLIGDSTPDVLSIFCDVMAQTGNCTELLEILQLMREIDRVIHEVSHNICSEIPVLADEKNINYDIGYQASDHSLKPLVELERVRASSDKRLSKTSSRNSAYSLLEGGADDWAKSGEGGIFPGLIMISVSITGHNLSGQRAAALASIISNHNCICELRIGKTQLGGEDVKVIAKALESNRTIHSIDLRLNNINHAGAQAIAELLLKTKSLRLLNLSSTGMDCQSIRSICTATSVNKSLMELDLSFLDISDEGCQGIRDMLRSNTSLQRIRLRSNNLTWSGCYVIAEGLSRNLNLNVFDISRNNVGDEGIQALAKFLPDSSVTELCVENCGLTSVGCEALAEIVAHCKTLRYLDVSTNPLLDPGIFKLAPALERTSTLQNLAMNMCGITNDGFSKLLDVLEKNTSIDQIKLCYNRLGKEHFNTAANSDNLRYRLKIVTSSKPKLKILLWGNAFDDSLNI